MQKRLRILIADPNRYHAVLVQREIERRFPSSVTAVFQSVEAAVEELQLNRYDIAVVDCSFAIAGGEGILAAVRSADGRLPLIMTVPSGAIYAEIDHCGDGLSQLITKDSTFHILIPQLIEHFLSEGSFDGGGRSFRPRLSVRRKADMVQVTANTLAHEINNPLMTILGITELLLNDRSESDHETAGKIQIIQESAQRIRSTLIRLGELDHPNVTSTAAGSLIQTERQKVPTGAGN